MGRRSAWQFAQHERERRERERVNPVWRGVGCVLIVVIGALGYAFAGWFLTSGLVYLPPELINPPDPIPAFLRNGNIVRVVVMLLFALTGFGVLNFIYALLFPVKPGEYDVRTPRTSPAKERNRRLGR